MHTQRRRNPPDWLVGLGLALVVVPVVFAVLGSLGAGDDPSFQAATQPGGSEAGRLGFVAFDGTELSLDDFAGSPLVIHFWASWCPTCVADLPSVVELDRRLAGAVQFLGMNSLEVGREVARQLAGEAGVTYLLAEDPDGKVFAGLGGVALPTTMVIDRTGSVVDVHHGAVDVDEMEERIRQAAGL